jgi:hypothetical protein
MAENAATQASRGHRTICLPIPEPTYLLIVADPRAFRLALDDYFQRMPELFPRDFPGYQLMGRRTSARTGAIIRRVRLKGGAAYSIRPSFLMPYMTARTAEVQGPLFLRKFGVPYWALARVFGRSAMSWYRMECALGRFSVAGTVARRAALPAHLLADEHHQTLDGEKTYIATTVGGGCVLGAEPAAAAGADQLEAAYGVFKAEARDVEPHYAPRTVCLDGWKGTRPAWERLFPTVAVLLCFLHGWLKVRDRAKHLEGTFAEVSRRVWDAYGAPGRRHFAQRLRRLREWAGEQLSGAVREAVALLCGKRPQYAVAYDHPGGHRTSNMLDRLMRGMNRYFDRGQHLHGSPGACRRHCRAWALLWDFAPWHPATARANGGWRSPAERLNRHRYHDCWLQNLLASASLDGYRCPSLQTP